MGVGSAGPREPGALGAIARLLQRVPPPAAQVACLLRRAPPPTAQGACLLRRCTAPASSGNSWMAGGKGAHGIGRFIRHLRMKHAFGIQLSGRMWPAREMPGQDHHRGTWWDQKLNCIAIGGHDFAQDTQEGGADQFVLIPDSDEEGGAKGSSLLGDNDEYVPETEPQDVVTVSRITGPCANQGRQRLGTMLHEWRRLISDVENESGKVDVESAKVEMDNVKLEKESAKVEMDSVKLEKEELDHMASFSDIEIDDEACSCYDGVDLRGHSQVEDDALMKSLLIIFVIRVGQLLFIKYDVDIICVHAEVMYDIIQGFLGPLHVGYLNQMDGHCCHLGAPAARRVEDMFEQVKRKLPEAPKFLLCVLDDRKNWPWKKKYLAEFRIVTQ
ncbi:uncharacterized protein [Setaria viridis]|uniref:uncharacterized protein isoform X2 n=1 Tax=Setaria viridis TaxID=4556 RepID=UPI001493D074|nr:uncharacterized protein LOC117849790 isoform X2 [Setaria viridis]